MRYFYSLDKEHLIIVPHRCSSSFFMRNAGYTDLLYLNQYKTSYNLFLQFKEAAKHKTIIWRDPFERLLSTFTTFIHNKKHNFDLFRAETRSDNWLEHLLMCMPKIEKNYKLDSHTAPISDYFTVEKEIKENYNVVHFDDVNAWLHVTFSYRSNEFDGSTKFRNTNSCLNTLLVSDIIKNMTDLLKLIQIQDKVKIMYAEDYGLSKYINRL